MADPSKIKVGDCIKFTARVVSGTEGMVGITRPEAEDKSSQLYLGGRWIEAAEHIPAPRVFKRGDWVSWRAHGAVQMVVADADDELVWVTSDDPANNILWRKQDCEPTEAPE